MQYNFITDFHKSRETRIGASEVSWLIPHPVTQIESLAAFTNPDTHKRHACTALDLYNDKINPPPWEYNFPAEMGHRLEGYAIFEFIKDNIDRDIAKNFLRGYTLHKLGQEERNGPVNPEPYNNTPFKHNTEAIIDYGVAHGDCLYDCSENIVSAQLDYDMDMSKNGILKRNGLTIDLSKPFLIEAKSARSYSVSARKRDPYKGYDLTLKNWQGIPLKVYFQIQYQMWLYKVDVCYLSLIFDTSEKHYWQIKANRKHQKEIVQVASLMKKCIDNRTPPRELVMNTKDIVSLYPEIKDDFREAVGEELTELLTIAKLRHEASDQEKKWCKRKEDADNRMSIHLLDNQTIKGMVNDRLQTIAAWKKTGGTTTVMGLGDIKKREDSKRIVRYLEKNELIKVGAEGRKADVKIKAGELGDV